MDGSVGKFGSTIVSTLDPPSPFLKMCKGDLGWKLDLSRNLGKGLDFISFPSAKPESGGGSRNQSLR